MAAGRVKTKPRGVSVVRGGRDAAGCTVGLLGAIFTYAVRQGLRPDNSPHDVVKFAEGQRQRRMTDDEYRQLGKALSSAQSEVWKSAIDSTRLMILTGWRRGEVVGLPWSVVDSATPARTTDRHPDRCIGTTAVPRLLAC
jgi:integrase